MELSIADLTMLRDGLVLLQAETKRSLSFLTGARGVDPKTLSRIQQNAARQVVLLERLDCAIGQALK